MSCFYPSYTQQMHSLEPAGAHTKQSKPSNSGMRMDIELDNKTCRSDRVRCNFGYKFFEFYQRLNPPPLGRVQCDLHRQFWENLVHSMNVRDQRSKGERTRTLVRMYNFTRRFTSFGFVPPPAFFCPMQKVERVRRENKLRTVSSCSLETYWRNAALITPSSEKNAAIQYILGYQPGF